MESSYPPSECVVRDSSGNVVEIKHRPGSFEGDILKSMLDKHPKLERIIILWQA
jgi:hypothetical protein